MTWLSVARWLLPAAVAVIALQRVFYAVAWNATQAPWGLYADFAIFRTSARCLLTGCDPYALPPPPNLNAPFLLWLFVPLAPLPIGFGSQVWLAVNLSGLAIAGLLIAKTLRLTLTPWRVGLVATLALGSAPVITMIRHAQIAGVLAVPMVLLWATDRRGALSPAWFAPLVIAKPFLGLLALKRALHQRHGLVWFILSGVLVLAVGVLLEGSDRYLAWATSLTQAVPSGNYPDGSLWQAAVRTCRPNGYFAHVPTCAPWVVPAFLLAAAVIVVLTLLAPTRSVDQAWLLTLTAGLLASPKGWNYYGLWAIGPAVAVWGSGDRITRGLLLLAGAIWCLPDTAPRWGQPQPWFTVTVGSLPALVWVMGWLAALRRPRPRCESIAETVDHSRTTPTASRAGALVAS